METIRHFEEYLTAHSAAAIGLGQSGAKVYRLGDNRIAKHVQRRLLQNDETWERYRREALFSAVIPEPPIPSCRRSTTTTCARTSCCSSCRNISRSVRLS